MLTCFFFSAYGHERERELSELPGCLEPADRGEPGTAAAREVPGKL